MNKPMNEKELKEFVKKAKVEFAPGEWIARNQEAVDKLILLIAPFHGYEGEKEAQDFLAGCFVSDQSTLGDFLDDEGLKKLGDKLGGITLSPKNRIWETAMLLLRQPPV